MHDLFLHILLRGRIISRLIIYRYTVYRKNTLKAIEYNHIWQSVKPTVIILQKKMHHFKKTIFLHQKIQHRIKTFSTMATFSRSNIKCQAVLGEIGFLFILYIN